MSMNCHKRSQWLNQSKLDLRKNFTIYKLSKSKIKTNKTLRNKLIPTFIPKLNINQKAKKKYKTESSNKNREK